QYRAFLRDRSAVHFNETLLSTVLAGAAGENAPRVRESRTAALRAPERYGVTLDTHGVPAIEHLALRKEQKAGIISGCYQLLIAAAEAHANTLPGEDRVQQANAALRLLDRAAELGISSRAFHLHRERFLRQSGRADEADEARDQAEQQLPK